ncbi:MAG TPA: sigma-70 family RNA polymerase sigma factor [Planctomycetaceae bacterium]|nr:sigma-70 family RNA polymerase sigma factor [Planctomycetaceae bacterium]
MSASPDTRASLLIRLKDRADDEAWMEFTEIYRPVIHRLARRKGLQNADAEDLVQHVLTAVARVIGRWQVDPNRAQFRTWLTRVAMNAIVNALTRGALDRGSGDSGLQEVLDAQPAPDGPDSQIVRIEHRREVFRWAARRIRPEFHPATWSAFWLTAVEGRDPDDVARDLKRSRGAVYAARSRVMRRLKEKVRDWEGESDV